VLCLALTGLRHAPPAITTGLSGVRIVAAVLSVALTILVLLAVRRRTRWLGRRP